MAGERPRYDLALRADPFDVPAEEVARTEPFFDRHFYLDRNDDVKQNGDDPLEHYLRIGWREGRNPSAAFETNYYLDANPDVAENEINPLYHYAVVGIHEGLSPFDKGISIRNRLREAAVPEEKTARYDRMQSASVLDASSLRRTLADVCGLRDTVLSLSHDPYRGNVGGTQLFIHDEQRKYQAQGAAYLHVAPLVARLRLADERDGTTYLRLTLNGEPIGNVEPTIFASELGAFAGGHKKRRLFISHCILGHNVDDVIRINLAYEPERSCFWVHDFSSVCAGYNLLRNDISFCGSPRLGSQACRICIYGASRPAHVKAVARLFSAVTFDVVAPSESAMTLWRRSTTVNCRSLQVHQHAVLDFHSHRHSLLNDDVRGTRAFPIRVAFVGHAQNNKGWQHFVDLVRECSAIEHYRFYVFSADAPSLDAANCENVRVSVSADDRDAMRRELERHGIDLVLLLSDCPETFSYAAYEAIAAGADIITFANSGNVAAEVAKAGRGIVVGQAVDLGPLFTTGAARRYAQLCYSGGSKIGKLRHCGTTASLFPMGMAIAG